MFATSTTPARPGHACALLGQPANPFAELLLIPDTATLPAAAALSQRLGGAFDPNGRLDRTRLLALLDGEPKLSLLGSHNAPLATGPSAGTPAGLASSVGELSNAFAQSAQRQLQSLLTSGLEAAAAGTPPAWLHLAAGAKGATASVVYIAGSAHGAPLFSVLVFSMDLSLRGSAATRGELRLAELAAMLPQVLS
jgi:hypothetical protein